MKKHLVRKQQTSAFRAERGSYSSCSSTALDYFFFAVTFLQTQFMPSFEGNGQRKAVLVTRKTPRAQAGGHCHHHSAEFVAPEAQQADQGRDLLGGWRGSLSTGGGQHLNLRFILRNSL